ncbi:hypothetical protein MMC30_003559 [Trapelia coarctata]|nr:hypothetical protein [Trapelia coarctata]
MVRIDRLGFSVVSPGRQSDAVLSDGPAVNVVLVHGLRGHPRRSWECTKSSPGEAPRVDNDDRRHLRTFLRSKLTPNRTSNDRLGNSTPEDPLSPETRDSAVFWPEDLLAPSIPNARILVYGYNADAFGGLFQANNKNSISQHGNDLMVKLERAVHNGRPIIFVAHSLGGIVVKDALRRCKTSLGEKYKDLYNRTDTVIFLGTPHRGSSGATWGEIASRLATVTLQDSNRNLLASLAVDNESLDNIHAEFMKMLYTNDFRVHSFQEGRGPTGLKGFSGKARPPLVVNDFSSKLDYPLEVLETIDADHVGMAKFSSTSSPGYRDLLQALQGYIRDAQARPVDRSSSLSEAAPYLQKLYCLDYDGVLLKVPNPYTGTCSWLTQNSTFVEWKRSERSNLCWLYGFPGYGKTVLAKSVIQHLAVAGNSGPQSPLVVHFFCLDQDERRKSSLYLLKSVLHQIIAEEPRLCKIMDAYHATMNWEFLQSLTALWRILREVSFAFLKTRPLYIILDGLDELSLDWRDEFVKDLLDFSDQMKNNTTSRQLKMFVTSRPESQFQSLFSGQTFKIELDTTRNNEDLMTFVSETVDDFARKNLFPLHLGQKIRTEIVSKAQGMFLWASLAWESFKEGVAVWTQSAVEQQLKALQGLPSGLHPLYQRLLSQVNPRWVPELNRLFVWLVAAVRPLSTSELAVALALRSNHRVVTDLDVAFSIPQFVKRSCPNLVKIDDSGFVSLVHQSFKEFLIRSDQSGLPAGTALPLFRVNVGTAHAEALTSCFNYLCLDDVCALSEEWPHDQVLNESAKARIKFCFLAYAALEWRPHFRLASGSDDVWLAFKRVFQKPASLNLMCHFWITPSPSGGENWRLGTGWAKSPFRIALGVRSKVIMKKLVEEGADINEGSPLFQCTNDSDMFEYLLQLGADPNNQGSFGCSPLLWAVREQNLRMVKALLKNPSTSLNMQDEDGKTVLHWATRWDWTTVETILDELLHNDRIDANVADKSGRTPVAFAAYWGKEMAVKRLLLSPKLSLERGDLLGESPLVSAAQQCWKNIVLGMLGRVQDISQHEDRDHRGIIHWAVINRWDEALRLVLQKPGCRMNKIDARGMTALHYAAEEGNYFAARLLLKSGAMADIMDNTGKTPAHVAAQCFWTQIVRLMLLERNLDVNEQDADGRTIIHWVATVDSTSIIHLLLDQGADLTLRDRDGRTPMHIAAFCRCPSVLTLLLDNLEGYNINSTDSSGNTLLHLAARAGYSSIVSDLIRRGGLLVNKRNSFGETALDCAGGLERMSQQLLDIGARRGSTNYSFSARVEDENDLSSSYTRPASTLRADNAQNTSNRYNRRSEPLHRSAPNYASRNPGLLAVFDYKLSFENWEAWYFERTHMTRPLCRGKLLDIYALKIGPCGDYAMYLVRQMVGDSPTYKCQICNSDGAVCREGSNTLNTAHAQLLYDMQKAKIERDNEKRNK